MTTHTVELAPNNIGAAWINLIHERQGGERCNHTLDASQATALADELRECTHNLNGVETLSLAPMSVMIGDEVAGLGVIDVMPFQRGDQVTLHSMASSRLLMVHKYDNLMVTRVIS